MEEGAFFIKDKKVISAKFSVNILRQFVMYVIFYHYKDNLWIQQRLHDLEILEIVSCGNLTRVIAVVTALS